MNDSVTVLVTAASGTHGGIGRHLAELLLSQGFRVRAMVRSEDARSERLRSLGVDVVVADFMKLSTMRRAVEGVDKVFFCYPLKSGLLQATTNLSVAAIDAGVKAIINVSIMLAAEEQPSPICRDHWLSEQVLNWAQVGAVHLRGGFFYENLLRFSQDDIRQFNRIALPFGDGRAKLSWVGAHDMASVAAALLAEPSVPAGQTYEVIGEKTLSIRDVADVFTFTLGRQISYQQMPLRDWLEHVEKTISGNDYLRAHVTMLGLAFASGRAEGRTNDMIERLTGCKPQDVRDFVENHVREFS